MERLSNTLYRKRWRYSQSRRVSKNHLSLFSWLHFILLTLGRVQVTVLPASRFYQCSPTLPIFSIIWFKGSMFHIIIYSVKPSAFKPPSLLSYLHLSYMSNILLTISHNHTSEAAFLSCIERLVLTVLRSLYCIFIQQAWYHVLNYAMLDISSTSHIAYMYNIFY